MKKIKSIVCAFAFLFLCCNCFAQDDYLADSLKQMLFTSHTDTMQGILIHKLVDEYLYNQPDSCLYYAYSGLALVKNPATKITFEKASNPLLKSFEMDMYANAGLALGQLRNDSLALRLGFKALKMAEEAGNRFEVAKMYSFMADIYEAIEEFAIALNYTRLKHEIDTSLYSQTVDTVNMAIFLMDLGEYDSALFYLKNVDPNFKLQGKKSWSAPHITLGEIYEKKGNYQRALAEYKISVDFANQSNLEADLPGSYLGMAQVFDHLGHTDSSIWYANYSLGIANKLSLPGSSLTAAIFLSSLYESKGMVDSAFRFQKMAIAIKDKLFNKERVKLVQNYIFNERIKQIEFKEEQSAYQNKIKIYGLLGSLVVLLLIAGILVRNNQQKQKLNTILESQKSKIENTLSDLKLTQSQLIHSEKMASLGEMTAGIAHEIQNPLNFVTNFSELNKELLEELDQSIDNKNFEGLKSITGSIKNNETKINHHALRADAIVKSMLLHSRVSSGQKEKTDINMVADECIRLAYHSMQARDRSFQCHFDTHFDSTLEKINIVPQEIRMVMMNLYNNALYSVAGKKKSPPTPEGEKDGKQKEYVPTVSVRTRQINPPSGLRSIEISIKDNGMGIPQKISDKIFQPFFTTKPTGQGTGLGLSLSYDIIKAHGGDLKVESQVGEYAEFTIKLPINQND